MCVCVCVCLCVCVCEGNSEGNTVQSAGAVKYTDCISAGRWAPRPMNVLDMTQNHFMVICGV